MTEIPSDEVLEHPSVLVKEYESLLTTLTEELECYKLEQNYLRNDSVTLLEENKLLSSYIKTNLQKFENPDYKYQYGESDLVQNLKTQVELLSKEKNLTTALWKNSLNTVDQLEDELRLYEGRTHG